MAKQPNLEKARLESEAYSKMIRNMINSLNSDLLKLNAKDDRIKTIPVEEDDTPRKMLGAADKSFKMYMDYVPPSADRATKERVKKKFEEIQKENKRFFDMPKKTKPKKRSIMSSYGGGK